MDSDLLMVADIVTGTSVDGPGLRTSIYFSGCEHRCPGCHNPSTWDHNSGTPMTVDEIFSTVSMAHMNVTLTGGDPVYHAAGIVPLARRIREAGLGIWLYTGFTFEDLLSMGGAAAELLKLADVVVDGPFIQAQRDTSLLFRGSANQRLIDVPASLAAGHIITWQSDF